jgi:hypothetical protein
MTHIKNTTLAFFVLLLVAGVLQADPIKITDVTGKFTLMIEILKVEGEFVMARTANGEEMKFRIDTIDRESLVRVIRELGKKQLNIPKNKDDKPEENRPLRNQNNGNIETISIKRLDVFGEKYVGKVVRFKGVRLASINKTITTRFPQTELQTDGLVVNYRKDEAERWVGFSFRDSNDLNSYTIANKSRWGELLLELEDDELIDITGFVVEMPSSPYHGIIANVIEKTAAANPVKVPKPTLNPPFEKPTLEIQFLRIRPLNQFSDELSYQATNHSKYAIHEIYLDIIYVGKDNVPFKTDHLFGELALKPNESAVFRFRYLDRFDKDKVKEFRLGTNSFGANVDYRDPVSGDAVRFKDSKSGFEIKITQQPEILKN